MACWKGKKAPIQSRKKAPLQSATNTADQSNRNNPPQTIKKCLIKPSKENLAESGQKVPDASVKSNQVQFDKKGLVHHDLEAKKKKTASDRSPVQPILQPPCLPLVKRASPWVRETGTTTTFITTTFKAQGPREPTQKKINDFFRPIVHSPHPCNLTATASVSSRSALQEVELLEGLN